MHAVVVGMSCLLLSEASSLLPLSIVHALWHHTSTQQQQPVPVLAQENLRDSHARTPVCLIHERLY
jgi:hypothetical protein